MRQGSQSELGVFFFEFKLNFRNASSVSIVNPEASELVEISLHPIVAKVSLNIQTTWRWTQNCITSGEGQQLFRAVCFRIDVRDYYVKFKVTASSLFFFD
jgi:hypothetical protein